MGISETIVAAMIGAIATVTTALFQLFTALRAKSKVEVRPKRGSTMRSVVAILALMVASAVGGFLYAEFQKQRDGEDMRAMRQELKELKELTTSMASARRLEPLAAAASPVLELAHADPHSAEAQPSSASVESVVYVPACRRSGAPCEEADAQRIALCGSVPAYARVERLEVFAQPDAVQEEWEAHRASLEQDLGGARFSGSTFEYAQTSERKAVCVNFTHWSADHPHIARILIHYGYGDALPSAPEPAPTTPVAVPAVIAAELPTTAAARLP